LIAGDILFIGVVVLRALGWYSTQSLLSLPLEACGGSLAEVHPCAIVHPGVTHLNLSGCTVIQSSFSWWDAGF